MKNKERDSVTLNDEVESNVLDELSQETLKIFAQRVRELRQERNLTLEALGNYLGYSRSSISTYEMGTRIPDIKVINAYSNFFNVSIDYLVGKTNMKHSLEAIACFSNLTDEDMGNWNEDIQADISSFIEFKLQQEKNKRKTEK